MPEVRLPTEIPRRKPPLRQRLGQSLAWVGFVGGGLVTPHLAAKAAARLWCKLPANAGRRKDNRPWPGEIRRIEVGLCSPLIVETWEPHSGSAAKATTDLTTTTDGIDLTAAKATTHLTTTTDGIDPTDSTPTTATAGGEPKTVFLMHGWGGWRGQVAAFAEPLTKAGFRVVALDALSHGESGPGRHGPRYSSGGELLRSLEAVAATLGQPYGVIAHSLGCAAACRALLKGTLQLERLALIAPSPDMEELAGRFARRLGFRARPERLLHQEIERRAQGKLSDFDIAAMGATGLLPNALVIHDAVDRESPYSVAQDIAARWAGATLITTDGLGHHRILIDPAVISRVAAHMGA
ncbi:MAG: alpha/beta hydrolase [Bifidobacteriaceae bacterium]|jgi:pimeloyl-ACP methyl ester carboxylesterase|nr:alpha/beta hydrolase [Bifidobacteriaceae bacterium]